MSAFKSVTGGYMIETAPIVLPDGRFAARAVVTRQVDAMAKELRPEFEPFATEAEAASAAHTAALAWISHPIGET